MGTSSDRLHVWTWLCGVPIAVLFVGGCTVGPEPVRPVSIADDAERFVSAPATEAERVMAVPELDRWWQQFDDPVTNELVEKALAQNTDLRAAAARVMQARAVLGVAAGRRWPAVDTSFGRDRNQRTFDFGDFGGGRQSALTTTYTLDAAASWQLDLFGRLRRQQEAEWYRLLASEADREAVLHSIVAEVVRLRALIASIDRELEIARARAESFHQTHELIQQRFDENLANALELRAAEENLAQSRAQIPPLEADSRLAHHALDVLLGKQPGTGEPLPSTLAPLPPQDSPPVGVPAALLDRRPDLRNTALRARAEQAEIGVAIAEMFPDLTLGASGGYQASDLNDLIDPAGQVWSLLLQAAMPVFRGGALRANVDRARAEAEVVASEYATQVLIAIREVEDALVRQETTWRRYAHLSEQVEAVRESLALAEQRYDSGLESLLDVLDVQRRRFDAETALVRAQQTLWESRISLCLALGGRWVGPPAENPESEETAHSAAAELRKYND